MRHVMHALLILILPTFVSGQAPAPILPTHTTTLAEYRRIALENQASLAAARASLSVAQTRVESLNKLGGLAGVFRRDLDLRKEQVQCGVVAAQAQLSVTSWETLYAVTRNYWSCVHAQEMLALAEDALDPANKTGLLWLRDIVRDTVEGVGGRRDLAAWHVTSVELVIENLRARKIEAEVGLERARAALREAMGVPRDYPLVIPRCGRLPWLDVAVCRERVVQDALTRRGEITQAGVFREVTALEAKAQARGVTLLPLNQTFAAGGDIHVLSVPGQVADTEYRPGAVGPEMPGQVAGYRADRVLQVEILTGRADAVVAKTRQLMTLQAEDAFLRYEKASREVEAYRRSQNLADQMREVVPGQFVQHLSEKVAQKRPKPDLDDVLQTIVKSSQAQVSLNQARYERLLALTLLERVTAGGFCPGFDLPLPVNQPFPLGR